MSIVSPVEHELLEFVKLSHQWVEEVDREDISDSIRSILSRSSYIDHCFIKLGEKVVAVVRMTYRSFYSFGSDPSLTDEQLKQIFEMLYRDIAYSSFPLRATVNEKYRKYIVELGLNIDFSRYKMILEINKAQRTVSYSDLELEQLNWKNFSKIVEMFIDSYSGTIDEQIGMFGSDIAHDAIEQVKNGEYGRVIPELSVFVKRDGKYIAGLLTSITEGELFVVIIGVIRSSHSKGIGRKLLSFLIDRGKALNYQKISLWVTEGNKAAIHLYQSMGFQIVTKVISASL